MSELIVPHYTGWRPRSMRETNASSETGEKRKQRAIYTHAKAYKHPEYPTLCIRADKLQ